MENEQKIILGVIGLMIAYVLYDAYQTPETGDDDQGSEIEYTLDTEGPGYVDLYVSGNRKGQYKDETKVFTDIPEGSMISLDLLPQRDARVVSASNKSFSFTTSTTSEIVFEETGGGNGGTDNPFGLTDGQWNVVSPVITDFLEKPQNGIPWAIRFAPSRAVFGFSGWFNDAQLAWNNKSNQEYAQDVADILKMGAPSPIIDCHVNQGVWGGSAPVKSKQQIISRLDDSEG